MKPSRPAHRQSTPQRCPRFMSRSNDEARFKSAAFQSWPVSLVQRGDMCGKFSTGCLTIFIQRRTVADSCPTISAGDEVSFRSVNLEGAQSEVIRAI